MPTDESTEISNYQTQKQEVTLADTPADELRTIPGDGSLADAFAVRRAVFIDEQGVSETEEMDGNDETARHSIAYDGGTPIGTGRVRVRGDENDVAKIERVAVRESYRNRGVGTLVMHSLETQASEQDCQRIVLHAQTAVEGYYEQLGYETISDEFEEAGITHVKMEKKHIT